jgi:hypothetical protein
MSIGAISNNSFPSIGYAITASMGGRTSLPVSPGMVIYSHFKHVSGTPAPEGTKGVNISKLKILDTLIEQLSKMKSQPSVDLGSLNESDEKRINALIEQYQKQIKAAQAANIYTPASPVTGSLFNIAA